MTATSNTTAIFKAILRSDGRFVAAIAAIPSGPARFFITQRDEDADTFIGRVSTWVKAQGVEGLEMAEPDVLLEGIEIGEVLMRLRSSLGAPRGAESAAEFDVANVSLEWAAEIAKASN